MAGRVLGMALGVALLTAPATARAQTAEGPGALSVDVIRAAVPGQATFEFIAAEPFQDEVVKGAPFSAEAVTEVVQTLADGNRIERRFTTSLWRDSEGRTRREQQVATLGPLQTGGEAPRLVTITDPVANVTYALNEQGRTATRSVHTFHTAGQVRPIRGPAGSGTGDVLMVAAPRQLIAGPSLSVSAAPADVRTEPLGTQTFDGVPAEGTRTTMTIPAGAIGNVAPIEVVTERWFSPELRTVMLLTRRDPRSGDSTYRLTNIVRAEPSADLFRVPSHFEVTTAPPPPPPPPPPPAR